MPNKVSQLLSYLLIPIALILVLHFYYGVFVFNSQPAKADGNTYVVDDTGDASDNNHGDGICATAGGVCTLRAAIEEAENDDVATTINFNGLGSGLQTITLASEFEQIDEPNLTITGEGKNIKLDATGLTTGSDYSTPPELFKLHCEADNFSISYLEIEMPNDTDGNTEKMGFAFDLCLANINDYTLEEVSITNLTITGTTNLKATISGFTFTNNTIQNTRSTNCGAVSDNGMSSGDDFNVSNNSFNNIYPVTDAEITAAGYSEGEVDNCEQGPMFDSSVTITDSTFENNVGTDVMWGLVMAGDSSGNVISNNTITQKNAMDYNPGPGIRVYGPNNTITGNTLNNFSNAEGIDIHNSTNVLVQDNVINNFDVNGTDGGYNRKAAIRLEPDEYNPNDVNNTNIANNTITISGVYALNGIRIRGLNNQTVSNVTVQNNEITCPESSNSINGIWLHQHTEVADSSYVIQDVTIDSNSIDNCGYGLLLEKEAAGEHAPATGIIITDNTLSGLDDNGENGINISANFPGVNITSNNISDFKRGISINTSGSATINSNNITSNTENGLYLESSDSNVVSVNTISSNTQNGVNLNDSDSNNFTSNTISSNTQNGVIVNNSSSSNQFTSNEITSNTQDGIYFNTATTNTFTSNTIQNNTQNGINLSTTSNANQFSSNLISNNTLYGVNISSSDSNTFSANTISSNTQYGIVLSSSTANSFSDDTISNNGDQTASAVWAIACSPIEYAGQSWNYGGGSNPGIAVLTSSSSIAEIEWKTADGTTNHADGIHNFHLALTYIDYSGGVYVSHYVRDDTVAGLDANSWDTLCDSIYSAYGLNCDENNSYWQENILIANGTTSNYTWNLTLDDANIINGFTDPGYLTYSSAYNYDAIAFANSYANTFSNETLTDNANGFNFLSTASYDNTVSNSSISSLGYDFKQSLTDADDTNYLDNTTFSSYDVDSGIIDVNYDVRVRVRDTSDYNIQGATVTATDTDSSDTDMGTTNSLGLTSYYSLDAYQIDSTGVINNKNDYTFSASHSNYIVISESTSTTTVNSQNQTVSLLLLTPRREGEISEPTYLGPGIPPYLRDNESNNDEGNFPEKSLPEKNESGQEQEAEQKIKGLKAGDLIKTQNSSTIYQIGGDGQRHIFPDEKTFFSWHDDFSQVKIVSSHLLLEYPLGTNMTHQPGSLIKLITSPKVYLVETSNILRWIINESVFYAWGYTFDLVKDLPEFLFSDYVIGENINTVE